MEKDAVATTFTRIVRNQLRETELGMML